MSACEQCEYAFENPN